MELVENKKQGNVILFASSPFQDFDQDCCHCTHCKDRSTTFCDSWLCKLHGFSCGWGFTCDDWKMKE